MRGLGGEWLTICDFTIYRCDCERDCYFLVLKEFGAGQIILKICYPQICKIKKTTINSSSIVMRSIKVRIPHGTSFCHNGVDKFWFIGPVSEHQSVCPVPLLWLTADGSLFTARNEVVMFLHLSGGSLWKVGGLCQGDPPPNCTITCGRNASYWNAFLFIILLSFNVWLCADLLWTPTAENLWKKKRLTLQMRFYCLHILGPEIYAKKDQKLSLSFESWWPVQAIDQQL